MAHDKLGDATTDGVALHQLFEQLSVLGAQTLDVVNDRPTEITLVNAASSAKVCTG
jgi:hypothetical protein